MTKRVKEAAIKETMTSEMKSKRKMNAYQVNKKTIILNI